jgi:hypothetical protein
VIGLIVYENYDNNASTISQHYNSFSNHGKFVYKKITLDQLKFLPNYILNKFDFIILHYSLYFPRLSEEFYPSQCKKIAQFKKKTIAFIQDEYREINNVCNNLILLGCTDLYSVTSAKDQIKLYGQLLDRRIKLHSTLTGFIDSCDTAISSIDEWKQRPIDIGYRARDLTHSHGWMGRKAFEKSLIAATKAYFQEIGLNVDISTAEEDRIYGYLWEEFLKNSKCTLIAISGASVCDFDGNISRGYEKLLKNKSAEEIKIFVQTKCDPIDGVVNVTGISPRVFEAARYGVLMIGYESDYSGILEPNTHYIVLKRDHSNLDQVLRCLSDVEFCNKIRLRAFNDLISSNKYSWNAFVENFEKDTFDFCLQDVENRELKILRLSKTLKLYLTLYKLYLILYKIYRLSMVILFKFFKIKAIAVKIWNLRNHLKQPRTTSKKIINLIIKKTKNQRSR